MCRSLRGRLTVCLNHGCERAHDTPEMLGKVDAHRLPTGPVEGWHGRLHAWLYWCSTGTPFATHVKTRSFYSQPQLQKHCTGVEGGEGGQTGPAVLSYSCVKHPVTLMRKHMDFSGVFGKANGAGVTLVSTPAHPLTLDNKARLFDRPPLAHMKGRHPGFPGCALASMSQSGLPPAPSHLQGGSLLETAGCTRGAQKAGR